MYREGEVVAAIRARLRDRGYIPTPRQSGQVHTFAIISQFSWHRHLLPDLQELGPVTLFDYVSLGYRPEEFYSPTDWEEGRIARRQDAPRGIARLPGGSPAAPGGLGFLLRRRSRPVHPGRTPNNPGIRRAHGEHDP